jgi:uncharacterized protein YndB with AHSA1/START domain
VSDEPRFRGEARTVIEAPASAVFDLITNLDRLGEWNSAIERVIDRPAELREGAEWLVQMHVPRLPKWRSRSTVRHIDRDGMRFVYSSTSDDRNPSYIDWFWDVADRGGASEVTVRWHGYPLTFFRQRVAAPMRSRQLEREVRASLDALTSCVRSILA